MKLSMLLANSIPHHFLSCNFSFYCYFRIFLNLYELSHLCRIGVNMPRHVNPKYFSTVAYMTTHDPNITWGFEVFFFPVALEGLDWKKTGFSWLFPGWKKINSVARAVCAFWHSGAHLELPYDPYYHSYCIFFYFCRKSILVWNRHVAFISM